MARVRKEPRDSLSRRITRRMPTLESRITRLGVRPVVKQQQHQHQHRARRVPPLGRVKVNNGTQFRDRIFEPERYGRETFEDPISGLRRLCNNPQSVIVAVAGSCALNGLPGARAGYGACFSFDSDQHSISGVVPSNNPQTSQYAVLHATTKVFEKIHELIQNVASKEDFTHVIIETSSSYLIRCLSLYVWKWISNGFLTMDGEHVVNARAFKYLHEQVALLEKEYGMRVSFCHLPKKCNPEATKLARDARR